MKIGSDALEVGKRILPNKVNLTVKMPHPIDFVLLSAEWERNAGQRLTEEEREEWKAEEFRMWVADQIEARQRRNTSVEPVRSRQLKSPITKRRTPFKTRKPRFI